MTLNNANNTAVLAKNVMYTLNFVIKVKDTLAINIFILKRKRGTVEILLTMQ